MELMNGIREDSPPGSGQIVFSTARSVSYIDEHPLDPMEKKVSFNSIFMITRRVGLASVLTNFLTHDFERRPGYTFVNFAIDTCVFHTSTRRCPDRFRFLYHRVGMEVPHFTERDHWVAQIQRLGFYITYGISNLTELDCRTFSHFTALKNVYIIIRILNAYRFICLERHDRLADQGFMDIDWAMQQLRENLDSGYETSMDWRRLLRDVEEGQRVRTRLREVLDANGQEDVKIEIVISHHAP
ncbi:hypothetical protein F5X96DRAFT_666363 [Biscogniauxia mediterranea]|nr:hypothetical protein F5X96DRAFT_666363 [Biscogniauxia mediterranea]